MQAYDSLPPLLSAETIAARVQELGATITRDFAGGSLVLVCVLKGSFVFAADLARAINLPVRIEFLGVRSYDKGVESSGVVQITHDLGQPLAGEQVLLVEDIVDTGLTLRYLLDTLQTRSPARLATCTLLHKPGKTRIPVVLDYIGFTLDNPFVVGYGLDHAEQYRNLPFLARLPDPEGQG